MPRTIDPRDGSGPSSERERLSPAAAAAAAATGESATLDTLGDRSEFYTPSRPFPPHRCFSAKDARRPRIIHLPSTRICEIARLQFVFFLSLSFFFEIETLSLSLQNATL